MEIQLATEQLVQADKLATLGQLVAGVAHDIANPTSYIHTSQEIMRNEVQDIENILELIFRDNNSPEAKKVRDKLGTHLTNIQRGLGDIKDGSAKITQIILRSRMKFNISNYKLSLQRLVRHQAGFLFSYNS